MKLLVFFNTVQYGQLISWWGTENQFSFNFSFKCGVLPNWMWFWLQNWVCLAAVQLSSVFCNTLLYTFSLSLLLSPSLIPHLSSLFLLIIPLDVSCNCSGLLLSPLLTAGTLWNLSSYEPLKMVIINHGLQTLTNEVIIPHSGWEHEPNEDSKPRDAEWTTVFKNTSGCLR